MEILSHTHKETAEAAIQFLSKCVLSGSWSHDGQNHAHIVGLKGDLGSGKTTFTQEVAKILGITEQITSPTFVIEKRYIIKNEEYKMFRNFIHIDAYRLESGQELEKLGWKELISEPNNLIFIEWPEKVQEVVPDSTIMIEFTFINETTRKIAWNDVSI